MHCSHYYSDTARRSQDSDPPWTLYVDGAVNAQGEGAGILFHGPRGIQLEYALQFTFPLTNNEAEYEAMITGLKLAKELGIAHLLVKGDSKLVIEQVKGDCDTKGEILIMIIAH